MIVVMATNTARVLQVFENNTGQDIPGSFVASQSGLTERQVHSSVAQLRNHGYAIDSPIKGRYIFRGIEASPREVRSGRMFEEVAVGKTGVIIIQDENGELYKATPIA